MRDLLNAFDIRNPHLAYRGSGGSLNGRKRRHLSPTSKDGNERKKLRKRSEEKEENNKEVEDDELEEVDCFGLFYFIFMTMLPRQT